MITRTSKNILLADDSSFFRKKLGTILAEAGHRVSFAIDGTEVQKNLKEAPADIDLLVLDLQMPGIDGFGVLEWMAKQGLGGRVPVLVVTGVYKPEEIMDRLNPRVTSGVLTKDFTPEQAVFHINRILFPQDAEDRLGDRVPVSAPVDYVVGDRAERGFLLNISTKGIFLHTRSELIPGLRATLKFSLPGSTRVYDVMGTVMWSTPPSERGNNLFGGAGVMFTALSEEDQHEIARFVAIESRKHAHAA